jgi:hypothetical protein
VTLAVSPTTSAELEGHGKRAHTFAVAGEGLAHNAVESTGIAAGPEPSLLQAGLVMTTFALGSYSPSMVHK